MWEGQDLSQGHWASGAKRGGSQVPLVLHSVCSTHGELRAVHLQDAGGRGQADGMIRPLVPRPKQLFKNLVLEGLIFLGLRGSDTPESSLRNACSFSC